MAASTTFQLMAAPCAGLQRHNHSPLNKAEQGHVASLIAACLNCNRHYKQVDEAWSLKC